MLSAAFLTEVDPERVKPLKESLLSFAKSSDCSQRTEAVGALAVRGDVSDIPLLTELLGDSASKVRVAAATAILRIDRRRPTAFKWLDWIVLAAYGIGMLFVGWFYSRVTNVEEYLLGGRVMKPWAVGISLFATLMSTLSYLSVPGEMIRHGPMILGGILSYPLVYVIVSRYIIPFIMTLRVTSAYEILELRFGLSVRMLGSMMFLSLRLLWMALIVYATSAEVVVPLLGLGKAMIPWTCAIIAIVTIWYTSVGGLQAVVFTDVVQTFIMLAGAILSIVLISFALGGLTAWWPTSWSPNWDPPSLFFKSDSRMSVGLAILSYLTWYVCTAGSDQLAIQRYLATRDVTSARRMFGIALCCSAGVAVLLAALGLALFAYFRANPAMLPDGASLAMDADQLLPQFIVRVLPAGISGLIIAGILSAAMDSLSAGVNSSCSVITVDWIDRFRPAKLHGNAPVHEVRTVSWCIGLVVVALSLLAGLVQGNLLEKCYTIVGLFTAPLFVLFFMAMFVPWATTFGTWAAAVSSVTIAVSMAYGGLLVLSFLWITPISLAVGILVGIVASLLPFGSRRPSLVKRE